MFDNTLNYTYVSQQANTNRQQAIDIAENRTNRPAPNYGSRLFGAGYAKKAFYGNKAKQNKIMNIVTKIRVNSWSNSLCALMPLWICPFSSTNVEDSLQINLFMQNKPNVKYAQINVSIFSIMAYENIYNWTLGQNKPNQTQFPKSQNERKFICYRGLQKKRCFLSPNKQTQFLQRPKMSANIFITKDYENETAFRPKKTNPILSGLRCLLRNCRTGQTQPVRPALFAKESLGLLITQQISSALRASRQHSLRQSLLGAFTLNTGMVKLLTAR